MQGWEGRAGRRGGRRGPRDAKVRMGTRWSGHWFVSGLSLSSLFSSSFLSPSLLSSEAVLKTVPLYVCHSTDVCTLNRPEAHLTPSRAWLGPESCPRRECPSGHAEGPLLGSPGRVTGFPGPDSRFSESPERSKGGDLRGQSCREGWPHPEGRQSSFSAWHVGALVSIGHLACCLETSPRRWNSEARGGEGCPLVLGGARGAREEGMRHRQPITAAWREQALL